MLQQDSILQALVLLREEQLVAYVRSSEPIEPAQLRSQLSQQLPAYMLPHFFVQLEQFPLTPNGKLDRLALPLPDREHESKKSFEAPRNEIERQLAAIWADVLGLQQVDIHTSFFEIGGDSILCLLIVARAEQIGLTFTPKQLFQYQTIAELATILSLPASNEEANSLKAVHHTIPLVPHQLRFFAQQPSAIQSPARFLMLEVSNERLERELLEQAIIALAQRHSILQTALSFDAQTNSWQQREYEMAFPVSDLLHTSDLSAIAREEREAAIFAEMAAAQSDLSNLSGPLWRMLHFRMGEHQPERLLIIVNDLLADHASMQILRADLEQLIRGEQLQPLNAASAFKAWAQYLQDYAVSSDIEKEVPYWLQASRGNIPLLPVDFHADHALNILEHVQNISHTFHKDDTKTLLHEVCTNFHASISEILLTALLQACACWLGKRKLLVDVESSAREINSEKLEPGHSVGQFAIMYPLLLDLEMVSTHAGLMPALRAIKEQIRGMPQRGLGYEALRYLRQHDDIPARLAALPQPEIKFSFTGQDQALARAASSFLHPIYDITIPTCNPHNHRAHLLEIDCQLVEDCLAISWTYCSQFHKRETVEMLMNRYVDTLVSFMKLHPDEDASSYTKSDFSGANLNQAKIDKVMAKLRARNKRA
ncbi:condensation domain-containing protein [Ktedonosporobacter rubrisoli]|uniref:condensation domain-containing protein n=1 Tax=Ktedonosporobacter rubrisoli TaxID=2509675 RepID=UPI001F5D2D9D|nr:condensation domain-containing protein [Ktedonosporobacter rubrisoli]